MTDIVRFPGKKRHVPEDGRCLVEVTRGGECQHLGPYEIDETLAEVECGQCRAKLSATWVLTRLARQENQYLRIRESCLDAQAKLNARSRTKCVHCGQMTRISQ